MNSKFIIRKSQKTILSLNIKLSKNSKLGELDIMNEVIDKLMLLF